MSISPVRCDGCKKELIYPVGGFVFEVKATSQKMCGECHNLHSSGRSRTWFFCSSACLLRSVCACSGCSGKGYVEYNQGQDMEKVTEPCSVCEGRQIQVGGK